MGGAAAPPYPVRHGGTVLVCGNAFCLHDDLRRARALAPDAPAIAVNGAAAHVRAFALFSQHPRNLPKWIASQRARFGPGFGTHAAGNAHMATRRGHQPAMPWVDHWWQGVACGGTSVWGARRMAALMGFERVILCGAPLSEGGYADGRMARDWQREELIEHYRRAILADREHHPGVTSMSGWTAAVLGVPG